MLMFEAESIGECVDGLKTLAKQFALTRGAEGAVLFDGKKVIEVPAAKVEPIDTNGAGDMYAGAFLYGLTHGMPFERCGELAGTAAAALITQFGARLSNDEMREIGRRFSE
jgi:sugar/nucleoside kinase (ribokinase family)